MRLEMKSLPELTAALLLSAAGSSASDEYQELVRLFQEWRAFQAPLFDNGVPDYTAKAMAEQERGLEPFRRRLASIDRSRWPIPRQVDYELVRAEMNGLDFDHRVLRPWSRNPGFYRLVFPSETDVPRREGPVHAGAIELWQYRLPLPLEEVEKLESKLGAIPAILEQAKINLVGEARDLWGLGIRAKRAESEALASLIETLRERQPVLAPTAERAREATEDFGRWLEEKYPSVTGPSGVGIENYDWYLRNVHLVPYDWKAQKVLLERELGRAWAHLKLVENRNRRLPALDMPRDEAEHQRRFHEAVSEMIGFLRDEEILTVHDDMDPALRVRIGRFSPPGPRMDFFTNVDYRDSLAMRTHGTHWFDFARMEREPHESPIRRAPSLYNLWDSRAEGFATGFEEILLQAGLFDERPRAQELIYVMLANRAARAIGDLEMHANRMTLEEAVEYAVRWTPRGWLPKEGATVWFDEELYLQQPGYGTSYVVGKVHIEKLLADRAQKLGEDFRLRAFFDEFLASGVIPVSLIRWEMTGLDDEMHQLWKP